MVRGVSGGEGLAAMRITCLIILLLLAWPAAADVLSPAEASARVTDGELTIIDVRLPMEWAETHVDDISEGMIGGANGPGWLQRQLPTQPCKAC